MSAYTAYLEAQRMSEPVARLRTDLMARAATGTLSLITAYIGGECFETPELRRLCFARYLYLAGKISDEVTA
jgi:hypothetical protein